MRTEFVCLVVFSLLFASGEEKLCIRKRIHVARTGKKVTNIPHFVKVDKKDKHSDFANSCNFLSVGEKGKNA